MSISNPNNINVIIGGKDLFCKICVYKKLAVYDVDEDIYKCPNCGSLYKYNIEIKKSKLSIDPEMATTNQNIILFKSDYHNKPKTKDLLPEVEGNIEIKEMIDINY